MIYQIPFSFVNPLSHFSAFDPWVDTIFGSHMPKKQPGSSTSKEPFARFSKKRWSERREELHSVKKEQWKYAQPSCIPCKNFHRNTKSKTTLAAGNKVYRTQKKDKPQASMMPCKCYGISSLNFWIGCYFSSTHSSTNNL